MIAFVKKIKKLLKIIEFVDNISLNEENEEVTISFKKNVIVSANGSIVLKSGIHTVLKTGTKSPGLLFLNPAIEDSDNVDEIVTGSIEDHKKKSSLVKSNKSPSSHPCDL